MESKDVTVNMSTLVTNTKGTDMSISSKIEELIRKNPPKGTDAYTAVQLMCVPTALKTKVDFMKGTNRNPRWGMVFSFSIVPQLDSNPVGPMMLPSAQSQFITADSIEEIRERILFEIDKSIALAKIAEENPDGYEQYEKSLMKMAREQFQEEDDGN